MVENADSAPKVPTGRPCRRAPCDCAQSSTTGMPRFAATFTMPSMSAGSPPMCATTTALVSGESSSSTWAGPVL